MPCNADHMRADTKELELSRVACLLDELDGKPFDKSHWSGYHPSVYDRHDVDADGLVSELCGRLQSLKVDDLSLEMQKWWNEHQEIDKTRELK